MKKWLKAISYIVAGLVLLVVALAALTQTRTFKNWLRDKIVQEAGLQLNGSLMIGRIDGNLISNFTISDLLLKTNEDTLAYLPELTVRLEPGKLLDRKISLKVVALDSPYVKLRQRPDSLWNAASLVKESEAEAQAAEPFSWQIVLEKAALTQADIRIFPLAKMAGVPDRVHGLNARLSAMYRHDSLQVTLDRLTFRAQNPALVMQRFGFESLYADSALTLKNVYLLMQETRIDGSLSLQFTALPSYRFQLTATPLSLDELHGIVPELGIAGKPHLTAEGRFAGDSLQFQVEITDQQSLLAARGTLASLSALPRFDVNGTFRDLQPARYYPALDSMQLPPLTGSFNLKGRGNAAENATADFAIALQNSRIQELTFERIRLAGRYNAGNASLRLTGQSRHGQFTFTGKIRDALQAQHFQVDGKLEHLDVGKVIAADSLKTDINLVFAAKGRGFHPDSTVADVRLNLSPSTLAGLQVDTLFFSTHIEKSQFAIDTLQLESTLGDFYLAGSASLSAETDLRFHGNLGDLRWIAARVGADTLRMNGQLDGQVRGKLGALQTDVRYDLADFSYNAIRIDSLAGRASVHLFGDSLQGDMAARLKQARFAEYLVDSLEVQSVFVQNAADVELTLAKGADLAASTKLHVQIDSVTQIDLADLSIRVKNQRWQTPHDRAFLVIADSTIEISGLRLSNQDQLIVAEGTLRPGREQSVKLEIANLDLPAMMHLVDPTISGVSGRLMMDAELSGTLASPVIRAKMQIRNGALTKVKYDSLNATVTYEDADLRWLFQLYRQEKLALRGDGFLPVDLMAPDSVDMVDMEKPFRFQVATSGIDLSFLQSFTQDVKNLNGLFVCDISIENTLRDPEPVGHLSIFNGTISIPEFGMKYKDIQTRLLVDKESIRVTELDVGTETKVVRRLFRRKSGEPQRRQDMRGRMWIVPGSYIEFDSTGFLGGVDSMSMKLRANEFLLANSSDYQAQISADIDIFGNVKAPRFEGKVTVLRSSVYLPALEASGLYDEQRIQSLLSGAGEDTVAAEPEVVQSQSTDYLSNLRGSLKIEIPKNSWVRGPDMNIELAGSLELVKDGAEFEQPFGTVQVVRGTYDLLNAYKFDIEEGTLFFEGGQEFNPTLDIDAKHTIRTQNREIHDLRLQVSNRMFSPKMKFFLDDEPVEITEALRFLVTGGYGKGGGAQSSGLFAANGGKEATGMLAGLLTSQLSRFLLNNQVLDVLEVKGDLTGEQASIVLGKYITNKLFLSLEKAIKIGSSNEEGISDEVTVEYALSRYLILQAIAGDERTTGFDIFWKFSK